MEVGGWPARVSAASWAATAAASWGQPMLSLTVLSGGTYHLPPVVSAHNSFWTWGPGSASDARVLVVDGLAQLRPYFASCRPLATFNPPDQVQSDWNDITIGVCTGPAASWHALWPHLKHYD